jgi:hypothetical protein
MFIEARGPVPEVGACTRAELLHLLSVAARLGSFQAARTLLAELRQDEDADQTEGDGFIDQLARRREHKP